MVPLLSAAYCRASSASSAVKVRVALGLLLTVTRMVRSARDRPWCRGGMWIRWEFSVIGMFFRQRPGWASGRLAAILVMARCARGPGVGMSRLPWVAAAAPDSNSGTVVV